MLDHKSVRKSTNCVDPTRYPRTKEIHARNTTRNPNPTTRGTRHVTLTLPREEHVTLSFLLLILMFKNTFIRYLLLILDPTQVYTKSRVVTLVPRVNHVKQITQYLLLILMFKNTFIRYLLLILMFKILL